MTSSPTNPAGQKPAVSMAELMAKRGSDVLPLKKGEEVHGTITKLSSWEIMMHTDTKLDVVVMEKDRKLYKQMLSQLSVGDRVTAVVLYPESDGGYPMVTLRRFMEEKLWDQLEKQKQSGEKIDGTVVESTKGGLVVTTDRGVSGFLPNSHMAAGQRPEELLGQKISVSIAELTKEPKKIIFSQKPQLTPDDFQAIAKQYKAGTMVQGTISGITTFGMFVSLPYEKKGEGSVFVDGLVHVSEVSWEKVEDLAEQFRVGQALSAVVIGIDPRSKRIDLSIKRLTNDPFQKILAEFPVDKKVVGTAGDMIEQGLLVDLGEIDGVLIEGLMKKDKIPPTVTFEKGQKVTATVVSVDSRKRKVMLTPVLLEKPLMYR